MPDEPEVAQPGEVLMNADIAETAYADNAAYQQHLVDQYKLYVEMADRISTRRQAANAFFLTINSGILGLLDHTAVWISLAGIILCVLWDTLLRSYRNLNTVKFEVIHDFEKRLPAMPYTAEWGRAGRGDDPERYKPLTHVETWVPWVFAGLHVVSIIVKSPP